MLLTDLDLLRRACDRFAALSEKRAKEGIRLVIDAENFKHIVSKLPEIDPKDLVPIVTTEVNLYDKEEIHHNCTVQVWMNTETGQTSIGWWPEGEPPVGMKEEE